MGKSILVMDTPKICNECPLFDINEGERLEALCTDAIEMKRKLIGPYKPRGVEKPDWCPLQDMPEKKNKNPYHNEYESGYVDGWNDCLDQILNGQHANAVKRG